MKLLWCLPVLIAVGMAKAETVKFALIDKAPFVWEENGQKLGFHYDVAKSIGTKTGYTIDVQLAPVMRVIELLRSHAVDFIILSDFKELEAMKKDGSIAKMAKHYLNRLTQ